MKKVTTIIRTASLEGVVKSLGNIRIAWITNSEIKGIAENQDKAKGRIRL